MDGEKINVEDVKQMTTRRFMKECTVEVVMEKEIKAGELIEYISMVHREGEILACVPRNRNVYEVTFADERQARVFAEEGEMFCNGSHVKMNLIYSDSIVVSFMHLPAYVSDDEIITKLKGLNIEILSDVKRRMHEITKIADGTRYIKVKFPPNLKSLPYSMKFNTVEGLQFFRVLHNNQVKVCYQCLSDNHVLKNCPYTKCYKCNELGHIARKCKTFMLCENCGKIGRECTCTNSDESDCMSDIQEQRDEVKTAKPATEKKDQPAVTTDKHSPDTKASTNSSEGQAENRETEETDEEENMQGEHKEEQDQRRMTRRPRMIKRPADDTVWSLVEGRKEKRERRLSDERKKNDYKDNERKPNGEKTKDKKNKK